MKVILLLSLIGLTGCQYDVHRYRNLYTYRQPVEHWHEPHPNAYRYYYYTPQYPIIVEHYDRRPHHNHHHRHHHD